MRHAGDAGTARSAYRADALRRWLPCTSTADSPARQAQLQNLTPLKMRFYPRNGKMHYWYADPYYCQCIFSGNEQAYDAYERIRLQQQMANQQELSAQMNEDAAAQENMNFMAWPPDPYFY